MTLDRAGPIPRHAVTHDHAAIGFCLDGEATMWVGATYSLTRGDVMLIPEGAPHHLIETPGAELYGLAVCTSCPTQPWGAALAEVLDGVRRGAAAVRHIDASGLARVEDALERVQAELAVARPARALAVAGLLSTVVVEVVRASAVDGLSLPPTERPLIADALAYIERHALDGISLKDVAAAVGRAPAHVAAVIKGETGRTVGDWVTDARMAFGRQLLLRSDETVESIADRLGYRSPSHFHRVFRRQHALTPGAWRALHQGGGAAQP